MGLCLPVHRSIELLLNECLVCCFLCFRPAASRISQGRNAAQARKYTDYFPKNQLIALFLVDYKPTSENGACQHPISLPTCNPYETTRQSEQSVTQCAAPSRSSAVGKLPLEAALSPTLQLLYTGPAPVLAVDPSAPESRRTNPLPSRSATGCAPSGCNDLYLFFRGFSEHGPGSESEYLCSPSLRNYQLAFVTPGIRPLEAISRNWIRLMPNRRM